MSEQGADPLTMATSRLESAVERLAEALEAALARREPPQDAEGETVPRAEVQALAERLDQTIARLRGALAEELRRGDDE